MVELAEADIQNAIRHRRNAALDGGPTGTLDRCTAEMNEFENGPRVGPRSGKCTLSRPAALSRRGQGRVLQNLTYTARQIIGAIGRTKSAFSRPRTARAATEDRTQPPGRSDAMYSKALRGDVYLAEFRALAELGKPRQL